MLLHSINEVVLMVYEKQSNKALMLVMMLLALKHGCKQVFCVFLSINFPNFEQQNLKIMSNFSSPINFFLLVFHSPAFTKNNICVHGKFWSPKHECFWWLVKKSFLWAKYIYYSDSFKITDQQCNRQFFGFWPIDVVW